MKAVRTAFDEQETRVLRRLKAASTRKGTRHWDYGETFDPAKEKKAIDPTRVFDPVQEAEKFTEAAFPPIQNIYETFGANVAGALGVAFNLHDPAVTADLLLRSNRLRGASDTTWHAVQLAIVDGEAEGDTIDGIAKRIGRVFDQGKGYRSRVIARTETVGAMNAGSHQAAVRSGVVEKKVWLAARDHRTRSTHVDADGQAVEMMAKFAVGAGRMDHPGDPSGGASEVINCRCTMLFKRTEESDVQVDDVEPLDPEATHLAPTKDEKLAALRTRATDLRARDHRSYPLDRTGFIDANVQREADLRALGAQIREEALGRVGEIDTAALEAKVEELTVQARAKMDELWHLRVEHFGTGTNPATGVEYPHQVKAGASRFDAYKKTKAKLDKERKAILEERNRVKTIPAEARGRAVLDVLRDLREMGVDPKAINYGTGSTTAAKKAVEEMTEWYPKEWWDKSIEAGEFQAKHTDTGRGYYGTVVEKSKGTARVIERMMTSLRHGDYRSTTVHELGHRMEKTQDDLTNLELRFWRRRTGDGNGAWTQTVRESGDVQVTRTGEGMKTYRYGKSDEIVNPDEFGDEYMGKSYLDRHSTRDNYLRERGKYISSKLDILEGDRSTKTTSFEVFTMGMEELVFNNYGSWDRDLDYIDFIIGTLAGV